MSLVHKEIVLFYVEGNLRGRCRMSLAHKEIDLFYVEGKLRGRFRVEMVRKSGRKSEMLKIETSFRFY